MNEGWIHDDYLVLLTQDESNNRTDIYKLDEYLPGYRVIGLKGWDDFIVSNADGHLFTVPTVPLVQNYLAPFSLPTPLRLEADRRFTGKIKWYVKPIVFGGDASAKENLTWLSHEQHAQAVVWWNEQFRVHSSQGSKS